MFLKKYDSFFAGKAFDITYIRLRFHSPKPESFAIFKKTTQESDWTVFQYYSGTCQSTYNVSELTEAPSEDETRALCTSEFSDISPLTGGNVIFRLVKSYYFRFVNLKRLDDI